MSGSNCETYILDTSAILTFMEDEDVSDVVNDFLIKAEKDVLRICLAFVSITEVFYITLQERDEAEARRRIELIQSLAIQVEESNEEINLRGWQLRNQKM